MKKIATLIVLISLSFGLRAQQDVMFSQYMFNGLFLNPAYAGSHKYFSSTLLHRSQWLDFEGAPTTAIIAVDGPLLSQTMGLGLIVANDKIGVTSQTDVFANYSYFLKLGEGNLGLGLKAGFSNYSSQVGSLVVWDTDDQVFSGGKQSDLLPKFGFGTYYYTEKWYVGLSIPTLLAYDSRYNFNIAVESSSIVRKHYFLTAGYVYQASEKLKLKPSFLVKYQSAAPVQADINLTAMYIDAIALGVSYRTNDALAVMVEYQANQRFRVGYAYDITTSRIRNYTSGSHEIMLGFDFGKDITKVKTPRFF